MNMQMNIRMFDTGLSNRAVVVMFEVDGANASFDMLHVPLLKFIRFSKVLCHIGCLEFRKSGAVVLLHWKISESKVVLVGKPRAARKYRMVCFVNCRS